MLNLGYRHKFDDSLTFVVTAQDVLGSARNRLVVETPTVRDEIVCELDMRAVFVGLTYSFGGNGKRPREAGFEFEGPQ
jgi:hypothetical protein